MSEESFLEDIKLILNAVFIVERKLHFIPKDIEFSKKYLKSNLENDVRIFSVIKKIYNPNLIVKEINVITFDIILTILSLIIYGILYNEILSFPKDSILYALPFVLLPAFLSIILFFYYAKKRASDQTLLKLIENIHSFHKILNTKELFDLTKSNNKKIYFQWDN